MNKAFYIAPCANGHLFTEWEETSAATCLDAAINTEKCSVCDTLGIVTQAGHHALGHSAGDAGGAIEATCEDDGFTGTGACVRCSIELTGEVIDAFGHQYHDWTEPTCTTTGNSERECINNCGTEDTRDTGYAALGHDWNWAAHTSGIRDCQRDNCTGTVSIGDTGPAGGKIFYVAPSGFIVQGYSGGAGSFAEYTAYYLEAAPADEGSSFEWGAYGTLIADVTTFTSLSDSKASLIGNGRRDTRIIVNHLGTTETGRAAQVCASKSSNGFSDWFLPSLGELNEMYKARSHLGISSGDFWSSSHYGSAGYAWGYHFAINNQNYWNKGFQGYVRAARAF